MYEIKTSNYIKIKTILIDGNTWTMKAPGAGDELSFSQSNRRLQLIQRKIENNTATDIDYDTCDKLENNIFNYLIEMFNDGTAENNQVKQWISNTPTFAIYNIIEDIKRQSETVDSDVKAIS